VAAPYTGRCLCGEIEYRLNEEPVTYYACYCTDCQKRSASGFGLSMWVKRTSLQVTKGTPALQQLKGTDGSPRYQRVCASCGVRLWSEPPKYPELSVLRPGTLDDAKQFTPVAHIWTRSKLPWVQIPEGAPRYEKQVGSLDALVGLWRDRAKSRA
jgi:hypothetical protein